MQREQVHRRPVAHPAVGDDLVGRPDAVRLVDGAQFVCRLEGLRHRIQQVLPVDRHRRRNDAATAAQTSVRAVHLRHRSRVENAGVRLADRALHVGDGRQPSRRQRRLETRHANRCRRLHRRTFLGCPPHPPAIHERHVRVAVCVQHPPDTRGQQPAAVVVEDDARPVADAKSPHQTLERLGLHHEARGIRGVANGLGVEPEGVGDMVFVVARPPHVEHPDVLILRVRRDPGDIDQLFGVRVADRRGKEQGGNHGLSLAAACRRRACLTYSGRRPA